jgi:hypothetical protein
MRTLTFIVLFGIIYSPTIAQFSFEIGQNCFSNGEYFCAQKNFEYVYNNTYGIEKSKAEILWMDSKTCAKILMSADEAFNNRNYNSAKQQYTELLEYNPQDKHAKKQLEKCNSIVASPKLRRATTSELTDIWNNKYGQQPQRRQNLINAGIDPDDAQSRINNGEGKPADKNINSSNTTLVASNSSLSFSPQGHEVQIVSISTTANTFDVPANMIPSWCNVEINKGYMRVSVDYNPNSAARRDWFKVVAGGKELRIYVEQAGQSNSTSNGSNNKNNSQNTTPKTKPSSTPNYTYRSNEPKFNAPKSNEKWGLNLAFSPALKNNTHFDCSQIGIKYEKLMRYGFGFNTGLNFEGYNLQDSMPFVSQKSMLNYGVNIPIHLEYRLNFARWFNVFAYGGVGINAISDVEFEKIEYPSSYEYGWGFRMNRIQLTFGNSTYTDNLAMQKILGVQLPYYKDFTTYRKFTYSLAWFF